MEVLPVEVPRLGEEHEGVDGLRRASDRARSRAPHEVTIGGVGRLLDLHRRRTRELGLRLPGLGRCGRPHATSPDPVAAVGVTVPSSSRVRRWDGLRTRGRRGGSGRLGVVAQQDAESATTTTSATTPPGSRRSGCVGTRALGLSSSGRLRELTIPTPLRHRPSRLRTPRKLEGKAVEMSVSLTRACSKPNRRIACTRIEAPRRSRRRDHRHDRDRGALSFVIAASSRSVRSAAASVSIERWIESGSYRSSPSAHAWSVVAVPATATSVRPSPMGTMRSTSSSCSTTSVSTCRRSSPVGGSDGCTRSVSRTLPICVEIA